MFTKLFANSFLVVGLLLTGAAGADEKTKDCCSAKLACCKEKSACCAADVRLGCCENLVLDVAELPIHAGRIVVPSANLPVSRDQAKKTDRVEHLQWYPTRSVYSPTSPHHMAVTVRLVFRFRSLTY
jgi:hypothetical protein